MKKYLFLLLVLTLISVPSVSAKRLEGCTKVLTSKSSLTNQPVEKSIVGTFKFKDEGFEWKVEFKSDKTCQFTANGNTYYGTWTYINYSQGEYFSVDMSDHLFLIKNGRRTQYTPVIDVQCKWLYENGSAHRAKNPNKRVELIRVK